MFITLEGSEGSGKTSQIPALADALRGAGYAVLTTREPGGTPIGDQIRNILMNFKNTDMHPRTEILLFQAARAQHVERIIRPALAEGKVVVCDRYADSTMAYQGYGYQSDLNVLRTLLDFATGGLRPDLTLLFDVDVEVGLRRRQASGGEYNRMDAFQLDFYQRVRRGYLELAAADPARWVVLDASLSKAEVRENMLRAVRARLQ
ncbi:MAG: dTMP kinase [Anaerolineaceae bacterium]